MIKKSLLSFVLVVAISCAAIAQTPPPAVSPNAQVQPFLGNWSGKGVEECGFRNYRLNVTAGPRAETARTDFFGEQINCVYQMEFKNSVWTFGPEGLVLIGDARKFVATLENGNSRLRLKIYLRRNGALDHEATFAK